MIDLYALTSPNVRKVYIMLEEVGLPYKEIFVDVWRGDNYAPEFGKVNPNRKIPVIVDHEGPGGRSFTVIESGAILMYLADKTGRLLPKETGSRYEVIQWLMLQVASVGPMFGQFTHFKNFAPAGNDYAMSRYQTEVRRLYEVLEERLGKSAYLGGAEYSIADIATFPWTAITMSTACGSRIIPISHAGPMPSRPAPRCSARSRRSRPSSPAARPPPPTTRTASSAAAAMPGPRKRFAGHETECQGGQR